jgi:hypothetical protein
MPIYAKTGESLQYIMAESQARKMPDLVLMLEERPSPEHTAQADGTWIGPDPLQKQIDAVEAKYAVKEQAIKERVLLVKLADDTLEAQRTAEIQAEWAGVQEEKNQEIEQVLLGGM